MFWIAPSGAVDVAAAVADGAARVVDEGACGAGPGPGQVFRTHHVGLRSLPGGRGRCCLGRLEGPARGLGAVGVLRKSKTAALHLLELLLSQRQYALQVLFLCPF